MDVAKPVKRMPREQRREHILAAATRAFARGGFAATGLEDVAAEAGVSHVILYRHFDSKAALYRAVLDRACRRLAAATGADDFGDDAVPALMRAAAADPDGFRLLYRHAAREPEFRELVDGLAAASQDVARRNLAGRVPPGPWLEWAAQMAPAFTTEAVIAWLDVGQPDIGLAGRLVADAVHGVVAAAQAAAQAAAWAAGD